MTGTRTADTRATGAHATDTRAAGTHATDAHMAGTHALEPIRPSAPTAPPPKCSES